MKTRFKLQGLPHSTGKIALKRFLFCRHCKGKISRDLESYFETEHTMLHTPHFERLCLDDPALHLVQRLDNSVVAYADSLLYVYDSHLLKWFDCNPKRLETFRHHIQETCAFFETTRASIACFATSKSIKDALFWVQAREKEPSLPNVFKCSPGDTKEDKFKATRISSEVITQCVWIQSYCLLTWISCRM